MPFIPLGAPDRRESLILYVSVEDEDIILDDPAGRAFRLNSLRVSFFGGYLVDVQASGPAVRPGPGGWHADLAAEVLENRRDRDVVETLPEWTQRALASIESLPDVIAHKQGTPRVIALPTTGKQAAAELISLRTANLAYAVRNGADPSEVTASLVRMMDEPALSRFYS